MMLCGSICTLLYIFFNSILPYELPLKWKRFLIRVNIGFYLLPLPWFAAEMKELARWLLEKTGMIFKQNRRADVFDATSVWKSFIVLDGDGKIIRVTGYQKILPVITAVLEICLVLLAGWVVLYMRTCSRYKRNMVFLDADHYLKDKNKGRKIAVGVSPCVLSPVTVGVIRPVILFPVDYQKYKNSVNEVILHELNHVSCMDIVERFAGFAVVVVHFFNPLAYYLFGESFAVSEMLSDEAAVKGRTKKQKADYIRCIMEASERTDYLRIIAPSLGVYKSLLRRRMEKIMGTNKKKVWKKQTVVAAVAVCAFAGSIPALAYQKPCEYVQNGQDDWKDKDILVFSPNGEENPMEGKTMDFDHGNVVFTDEDGNTAYNITQGQQGQKQNICAHSYVSGTIAEHEKHADGSCTVVIYEARKCAKCANTVRGSEISRCTYRFCPHREAGSANPDNNQTDEIKASGSAIGVVNTDALRVRTASANDAAVVNLLKEGEIVGIISEEGDFYKILISSGDSDEPLEGYVRKEYLDKID